MHVHLTDFDTKSTDELIQALKKIPAEVTSLSLHNNDLGNKTEEELAQVFLKIPRQIKVLNLFKNNLNKKNGSALAKAFAELPSGLTSLTLSGNNLGDQTLEKLEQAFAALPSKLTELNLSGNNFGNQTLAKLLLAFAKLPLELTSLHLGENNLGAKTGQELAQIFKALRSNLTSLDLGKNNLNVKTGEELAQAFEALPSELKELHLSENALSTKTWQELAKAFAKIHAKVVLLNLSANDLDNMSRKDLAQLFTNLPVGVRSLNLSSNHLGRGYWIKNDELVLAFSSLPARLRTIDLSWNDLDDRSAIVFAALPQINRLTLSLGDIDNRSSEDLISLGNSLPYLIDFIVDDYEYDNFHDLQNHPKVVELKMYAGKLIYKAHKEGSSDLSEATMLQYPSSEAITEDALEEFLSNKKLIDCCEEIELQLGTIKEKSKELMYKKNLKYKGYEKAHEAAETFCSTMTELTKSYFTKMLDCNNKNSDKTTKTKERKTIYDQFKTDTTTAINTAKLELGQHKGWKELLLNLALCIAGLGIGYLAICAYRGRFFKTNTDSEDKLDAFQDSLGTIARFYQSVS